MYDGLEGDGYFKEIEERFREIISEYYPRISKAGLKMMTNSLLIVSRDSSRLLNMIKGSDVDFGKDLFRSVGAKPVEEPFNSVCRKTLKYLKEINFYSHFSH